MFLFTPSLKNSHWAQSLAPWVLVSSQVSQNFYRLTAQFEAKRSNCSTKSFLSLVPNYITIFSLMGQRQIREDKKWCFFFS